MVIQLQAICKSYGDKRVLHDISLHIEAGQVIGYLGPNGAGKTTTVKILTATHTPDSGTASICGFDPARDPIEVRRRVGYVPETPALYESMTPMEFGRFVGRLHGIAEQELDRRLESGLEIFGLRESRHELIATFSKGMKQKVAIVTGLIHNPPVVILDEPLNGLDAGSALLLKEIIARLAEKGRTVFYCSHLLDVVEKVCHRVVILREGRILADGTCAELREKSSSTSLEGVFRQLTSSRDLPGLAESFVNTMAGVKEG